MSHSPCIRGLKQFGKGCPEKKWDGRSGCPAWIDKIILLSENPKEYGPANMCIDVYMAQLHWDINAFLAGIQRAIESFRNNMTEATESGNLPKTSRGLAHLINIFEKEIENRNLIYAHETRKKLNDS